jgi:hypothetical protein
MRNGWRRIVTTDGNERVFNGTVIGKVHIRSVAMLPPAGLERRMDKRPALIARCTGTADVIAMKPMRPSEFVAAAKLQLGESVG